MSTISSSNPSPSNTAHTMSAAMNRSGSNRSIFRDPTVSNPPTGRVNRTRRMTMGEDDMTRNISADYQEIQMRTLTKWVNVQLSQVNDSIQNIATDLRDGKRLLKLLAVVSKDPPPKPERMNMRIHQLSNVAQALSFLETQVGADSMPDIGNEAIVNGDMKKTLALLFFIMLKYQIQLILSDHGKDYGTSLATLSNRRTSLQDLPLLATETSQQPPSKPTFTLPGRKSTVAFDKNGATTNTSSATDSKVALLFWVRIQLEDYIAASIIPSVQDFSRSWRTGLAFCLLIHRHNPLLIPDILSRTDSQDKAVWLELLTLAFDLASSHMGISNYLEPADLIDVDHPHEPSVMMYVSEYYKVMSSAQKNESPTARQEKSHTRRVLIAKATGGEVEEEGPTFDSPPSDLTILANKAPPSPLCLSPSSSASLLAPVPVPMPSARRKIPNRQSTLCEEDKARIKADLNSRLMMQLTGHLPHGVHPVLDQLLTIHDTVLTFVKTGTRTIDEIPEEFERSVAVAEYIEALDSMEEQSINEAFLLQTAQEARTILVTPPETADDTLIRLTDHQRGQVVHLHDNLVKEWKEFTELLRSTKTDLLSIESDLMETEEGVKQFQHEADIIQDCLYRFAIRVTQLLPSKNGQKIHPLSATSLDLEAYDADVKTTTKDFDGIELRWRAFRSFIRGLSPAVLQLVQGRSKDLQERFESLGEAVRASRRQCTDYRRAMTFAERFVSLHRSLEAIEAKMSSSERATTDVIIVDLENKVNLVRSTLYASREEYSDLMELNDPQLQKCFDDVHDRYVRVRDWVDQIRQWFGEAERISKWINARTSTLEIRLSEPWKPLAQECMPEKQAARLHEEHEKIQREIEQFNTDDMERLRAHVKSLTGAESDRKHDLSPADTSTIEITLKTLNDLNRLLVLLGKRTHSVELLWQRLQWERMLTASVQWIDSTDQNITEFLQKDAWWQENGSEREIIVSGLVSLEKQISLFDTGDYTTLLEAYQAMEDLIGETLPAYLDNRQSNCELSFAELMTRCAFARKVVEQCLVIQDVLTQCLALREQGDQLRSVMMEANESEDDIYGEAVQNFKDSMSHWVTEVAANVPYTEVPSSFQDQQDQRVAHERIRTALDQQNVSLYMLSETLEELLSQHRQNLSLQQRATLAQEEMARLTVWMDDRTRTLDKTIIATEGLVAEDTLERLEKERNGIAAQLLQMEYDDLAKARECVRVIENEIDETNAVSIDRQSLVNGVDAFEQSYAHLKERLEERENELVVGKKRIHWQRELQEANDTIIAVADAIWDFIIKYARYDTTLESLQPPPDEEAWRELMDRVANVCLLGVFSPEGIYNELEKAYEAQDESVPETIEIQQKKRIQDKDDLAALTEYASDLITQHNDIVAFLKLAQPLLENSQSIRNTIVKYQRRNEKEDDTESLDLSVMELEKNTHELWENKGSVITYPLGQSWLQLEQAHEWISEHNDQVRTFIKRVYDELLESTEDVRRLSDLYCDTTHKRQLRLEYEKEITELQQWVEAQSLCIRQRHISLDIEQTTDVSEQELNYHSEAHKTLAADLVVFDSSRLGPLRDKIEDLTHFKEEDNLTKNFMHLKGSLEQLNKDVTEETIGLAIMTARNDWEQTLRASTIWIETMNEQLRQCTAQKNKWLAQDDGTADWASMKRQVVCLEEWEAEWCGFEGKSITKHYDAILVGLGMLNRPVPEHVQSKMETYTRVTRKLKETIQSRAKELVLIEERCAWEQDALKILKSIAAQEAELSAFVEDQARWTHTSDHIDPVVLRASWATLNQVCAAYETTTTSKLKATLETLQETASIYTPPLISETLWNKLQEVEEANSALQKYREFANAMVDQCCLVTDFLIAADALEATADEIREEFLMVDEVIEESERLDELEAKIKALGAVKMLEIPYPVRPNQLNASQNVRDDTSHVIIRDMLKMKIERLVGLTASLRQLLLSRASMTRRQITQEDYQQQLETCGAWIDARLNIIKTLEPLVIQETVDLESLRHAVSGAESMVASMQGNVTMLHSLTGALEKCKLALDGVQGDEEDVRKQLMASHTAMKLRWDNLQTKAIQISEELNQILIPAEHMNRIEKLLDACCNLQEEMQSMDSGAVTDEKITMWQHQIDHLETREYNSLQKLSTDGFKGIALVRLQRAKQLLEQAGDKILETRASLTQLYDLVNLNRLRNTHAESAVTVQLRIDDVHSMITTAQKNFGIVPESSVDARAQQYQALVTVNREIKQQISNCEEAYDDLCGYYSFMQMQGEQGVAKPIQTKVDDLWTHVREEASALTSLVARHARWGESYDTLDRLHHELKLAERELEITESNNAVPEVSVLDDVEKRMRDVGRSLESLAAMTQNVMAIDTDNATLYNKHHSQILALSKTVRTTLSDHKLTLDRLSLAESFGHDARRLCGMCEEQLSFIKQRTMATPEIIGKKAEAIKQIIKTYTNVLNSARDIYKRCRDEFEGTLSEQADRLTNTLHYSRSEVNRTKQPLERLLNELDHTLKTEDEYCKSLTAVSRHAQLDAEVHKSMDDFKVLVSRYAKGVLLRNKPSLLPDVTEFRRRYTLVDESIQHFYSVGGELKSHLQKTIGVARMASIARNVDQRHDDVKKKWSEIKMLADETKIRLEETQKRQNATAKLIECSRYVSDLKDRLNTLKFAGKSVAVEELEFKGLMEEIEVSLVEKIAEADRLVSLATDTDNHLRKQKLQLNEAIKELHKLVTIRQQQAKTEGNITLFMGMIDQIDDHISQLSLAIDKAAPHHAGVTNDRLNKPELHVMLRTLVNTFKASEAVIVDLLAKARSEAQKQFLDDNARVSRRLEKTVDKWKKVTAASQTRQREIQACIHQLNNEYFAKLATTKNSPRTKNTTPPPQMKPNVPRQSQGLNGSINSNGTSSGGNRRPSFKETRQDNRSLSPGMSPAMRRSQTPNSTRSRERQTRTGYVADPKNELDVQLGRIVNESPYQMKIKMVQGQAGKYWFGDEHPRLVYCRILPSQLVMVRVGGGWVDLTKFLKDHGHPEAIKSDPTTTQSSSASILDNKSGTNTPTPMNRRVSNASNGALDSAYGSVCSTGQLDGDKYVQTNEEGRKLVMKMTKAEENAKMPLPKKKS
ncbi:hypothetical protein J3Q64DRAFT_1867648 [Phycomyces blakesleeanus]|uniref:Calponin-homology (CH) domain-containing protein n=2 Tax=Phycomyces blakesleeanus TaxID=4837 RepID=A0ABR3B898_PHYBL